MPGPLNFSGKSTMNGFGERPKLWSSDLAPSTSERETSSKNLSSSMNAISFGFVATAILISMFLIMAIFEHLLRPRSSLLRSQNGGQGSLEMGQPQTQMHSFRNLKSSHAVATPHVSNFSVVMPGQQYPTYLAQPAPLPCPREGIQWPSYDHHAFASPPPCTQ